MSDDQIRDLFQTAETWSPHNVDGADAADGDSSASISSPNATLPPLQLGSDVEIAGCVAQYLRQKRGEVIFSEGALWYYALSHWRQVADYELRLAVHGFDGAALPGNRGPVKLSKTRVDSVIHEMTAMLARPEFFAEAPVGINCASGFIAFASDGTPTLRPHDPEHRCRHVLRGSWNSGWLADEETIFVTLKPLDLLLARLLEGVFLGDADGKEKRQLLAEIAGAAALGYGNKLRQPKAIILEGKTAENGKSQVLDVFRGLLPPQAIASIPAAKMGDQHFVVGLVGKHLNASDELSGADAIAGDVFKAVVTGEPVTGRDLYRPAVTFRSVAQNVFATNALPSFKGGMDRGVQRRLLVITFNRTIPEDERVENIGSRIADEEADFLLRWAVAGASRLIGQRGSSARTRCLLGFRAASRTSIPNHLMEPRQGSKARTLTRILCTGHRAKDSARTHFRPSTALSNAFAPTAPPSRPSTAGTEISSPGSGWSHRYPSPKQRTSSRGRHIEGLFGRARSWGYVIDPAREGCGDRVI